jgi:uncharacterized protein YoxC
MPIAFTWGNLGDLALAIFLILTGLALAYGAVRIGATLGRVSTFIKGAEREVLPLLSKLGGTVDRVNDQLDKVDHITDSAVDAVDAVDHAVRTVTRAVSRPVQKLAGLAAGVTHGSAWLKNRKDLRGAVRTGKEAAARREQDFVEDLEREEEGGA